jgi:hypothetical protein
MAMKLGELPFVGTLAVLTALFGMSITVMSLLPWLSTNAVLLSGDTNAHTGFDPTGSFASKALVLRLKIHASLRLSSRMINRDPSEV